MPYVVKSDRHYTNGTTAILYHKGFSLCFHECETDHEKAKQFRTKSEATKCAKELGKAWHVEKVG